MTSTSDRLVPVALIASVVAGVSPAIILGITWLVISLIVIPLAFVTNLFFIVLGSKLIAKFKLNPIPQLYLVIPMGLIGALAVLLLFVVATNWNIELSVFIENYYLCASIGFIAATTSWLLYNFGPLKIEAHRSNKAPQTDAAKPRR